MSLESYAEFPESGVVCGYDRATGLVSGFSEIGEPITERRVGGYSAFGAVLEKSSPSNDVRTTRFFGATETDTAAGPDMAMHPVEIPETVTWDSHGPLGFAGGEDNLFGYVSGPCQSRTEPGAI
jgi:hypothetical protein